MSKHVNLTSLQLAADKIASLASVYIFLMCVSGPAIGGKDVRIRTMPDLYPWSGIQIWGDGARGRGGEEVIGCYQ